MRLHTTFLGSLLAFTVCSAERIIATDDVPLLGPSFISNFDPTNSKAIRAAKSEFPTLIENLFSNGSLNRTDLVFSIDVFSAATNSTIYSYFHVGEGQNKTLTADKLDDQSISRIGSVTKLFTAYALLAKAGLEIFSHPVTKYLPELKSNSTSDSWDRVHWEDVTIGALASQQAGSGGAADFLQKYANDTKKYTSEAFLEFMRDEKHPVISPFRTAVYSDGGYAILGLVLERLTNMTYQNAVRDILFKPIGLDSMSTTVPSGSHLNAINRLPLDANSSWGVDIPIVASSGGLYANSADLRTAGLSILNSELLSAATTQDWMKPRSGTGSLVELVGAPWEITRLMIPVTPGSNRTRVSDLYLKAGGSGDYTAIFALSPDHGIGYSILVAGSTATPARWPLRDVVGETFIPAAEFATVENARRNLVGTFVDEASEGTNLTLTVDEGRPGLGLDSFYVKGVDSRAILMGATKPINVSTRLYPTGINSVSRSLSSLYKSKGTIHVAHRMIAQALPLPPRSAVEGGKGNLFDHSFAWMNVDFSGPLDEFILEIVDGRLIRVKSTGAGIVLKRRD